jgi:putative aldouronate transport system substrate-binding protein
MNKKRVLALVLTTVVTAGLLMTGCKKEIKTNPADNKKEDTPLTFSMYIDYDWSNNAKWASKAKGEQWIEENKKVTIDWVLSNGAAKQKFSTMVAANELPDVIQSDRGGQNIEKLIKANQLVDLTPYYNKYPNMKKMIAPETLNMLKSEDGKIYVIPNWPVNPSDGKVIGGNAGWVINKEIHKALGSPKLETFDELYEYLKAVKAKYPDVIPFEAGNSFMARGVVYAGYRENAMLNFWEDYLAYPDGKEFKLITEEPAFKESALFMSKLFREKLISQDAFTQTKDQVIAKFKNGKVAVAAGWDVQNNAKDAAKEMAAQNPETGYEFITPIKKPGISKVTVAGYNTLGWNVTAITKAAKDPERIFEYFDWNMSPEGQNIMAFGPKGLFWNEVNEKGYAIPNDAFKNAKPEELKDLGFAGIGHASFTDGAKAFRDTLLPEKDRDWGTQQRIKVISNTTFDSTAFTSLIPTADTEEGKIYTRCKDLYQQAFAKMIFAKNDAEVNSIIEKLTKDLIDQGYEKVLKVMSDKYANNLKVMGK